MMSFLGPTEIRRKNISIQLSCAGVLPQDPNKKQEVVSFILQGTASLQILGDYICLRFSLTQSNFKATCRDVATDFSGE